jgi:hypothetical protein
MLRRIFGLEKENVARGWRTLHKEELHTLYTLSHITRVIKSRRTRWVGHVAHIEEMKNACKVLFGRPECRWGILDWILGKSYCSKWGPVGCCEHGNEP